MKFQTVELKVNIDFAEVVDQEDETRENNEYDDEDGKCCLEKTTAIFLFLRLKSIEK